MGYTKQKWCRIDVPVLPDEHERIKAAAARDMRSAAVYCRGVLLQYVDGHASANKSRPPLRK